MVKQLLLMLIALAALPALATTRYVAQTAGTFSGGTACNGQTAITPATFNGITNSAGDTNYICGTITVAANTSGFVLNGSGTSSSPISLVFDTGAILQSTAFAGNGAGGGIVLNGVSYWTVNGQNTGIIRNTANGSSGQTCVNGSCSVQQSSYGVFESSGTGIIIENLTIQNLYMEASNGLDTSGAATDTDDIYLSGGSSITIANNTLKDSHIGIQASFDYHNLNGVNIYSNTIQHHGWAIEPGNGTSTSTTAVNVNIYHNDISNWNDWGAGGPSYFHTDGIITYNVPGSVAVFVPNIYGNHFYGDLDGGSGSATGYIWCNDASGGGANTIGCVIANNVFDMSAVSNPFCPIWWHQSGGVTMVNNTVIGNGMANTCALVPNGPATIENNIFVNFNQMYANDYGAINSVLTSNKNAFYQCVNAGSCFQGTDGTWSFSGWQGQGHDVASITSNPLVNSSTFLLGSGSPAIGLGANLYGSGAIIYTGAPQTFGAGGTCGTGCVARPSSGAWDAGAYQYIGATPNPPVISVFALHP